MFFLKDVIKLLSIQVNGKITIEYDTQLLFRALS